VAVQRRGVEQADAFVIRGTDDRVRYFVGDRLLQVADRRAPEPE
jgi:hypothetical protein